MELWVWIVIAVVVVAVILLVVRGQVKRREKHLRAQFGPEYDRMARERGERQARGELKERERRRSKLEIRALPAEKRDSYARSWKEIQTRFVNDPEGTVRAADSLVTKVMADRGYPMDDFDRRVDDVSVDYPEVVSEYRTAHEIAVLNERKGASTEQLRQATIHFRSLFERLLEAG